MRTHQCIPTLCGLLCDKSLAPGNKALTQAQSTERGGGWQSPVLARNRIRTGDGIVQFTSTRTPKFQSLNARNRLDNRDFLQTTADKNARPPCPPSL